MIFEKTSDIPISINSYGVTKTQYYFNKELKLIFILKGKINVTTNNNSYSLSEGTVFLVNNESLCLLEPLEENVIITLNIDSNYFNNYYKDFSEIRFYLNTKEDKSFWRMLLKIIESYTKKEKSYALEIKKRVLDLILVFITKYIDEKEYIKSNSQIEDKRIEKLINFINIHYKEKLTLDGLAKEVHLNPQYLSRYFSKYMGLTLNDFISNVRLKESLKDLKSEKNKITYVALENGFPNLKSYFKVFKEKYNTTPSIYRKNIHNTNTIKVNNSKSNINLEDIEIIDLIKKYCSNEDKANIVNEKYIINCEKTLGDIKDSWNKIICFGRASEGLRAEWRHQLRTIQQEIPFKYIRFHGIFSDDMMIYNENSNGEVELNFSYIDELIDFLLEVKLKPFIELSYMPESLASEKKYMFNWKANISYPKSLDKWESLVRNFTKHLINRYGIDEVTSWYFEIWDNFTIEKSVSKKTLEFFKRTYSAVKKVNSKLKVGGINNFIEILINTDILKMYNEFFLKENIELDFISLKIYSIKPKNNTDLVTFFKNSGIDSDGKLILQDSTNECVYAEELYISENLDKLMKILDNFPALKKQIFITEWNLNADPRDLVHDTCFKASYLVKNVVENFNKVDGMGYWTFTDIFEEVKTSYDTFHGGLGFVTSNGLKKPIYNSYKLLNKLGSQIIEKGEDFIVTKNSKGVIQILAYNYCHFKNEDIKYNEKEVLNDRYSIFKEKIRNIKITLLGVNGNITKKIYRIIKENGSVYDEWIKIGAQKNIYQEEIDYLKQKSIYGYKREYVFCENYLEIDENMQPHEVMLIEVVRE